MTAAGSARTGWGEKIRYARDAKEASAGVYEQTIRDAHEVGGLAANAIAGELGIRSREQITKYLRSSARPDHPLPSLPTVVYLRGEGCSDGTWERIRRAMAARGWYSTTDRQQAWHLSRAHTRVVHVDFSAGLRPEQVLVELWQAVHRQPLDTPQLVPLSDLLPPAEAARLEREHPAAAAFDVRLHFADVEWKVLAHRSYSRPMRWVEDQPNDRGGMGVTALDEQAIARWVADLLD